MKKTFAFHHEVEDKGESERLSNWLFREVVPKQTERKKDLLFSIADSCCWHFVAASLLDVSDNFEQLL